jgi:hypothetical protein
LDLAVRTQQILRLKGGKILTNETTATIWTNLSYNQT